MGREEVFSRSRKTGQRNEKMINKEIVSLAKRVLGKLNPNFDKKMKMGMQVEFEHGKVDCKP